MDKKEIIKFFLERDILLAPDFFANYNDTEDIDITKLYKELNNKLRNRPLVFTDDALSNEINNNDIIWNEFDRLKVNFEKGKSSQVYNTLIKNTTNIENNTNTVTIQVKSCRETK